MIDSFGRKIDYLRLSVTDRCNLRCLYCMGEDAEFVPHSEVLRIEEFTRIARCFIRLGITKIRITGGEPLVHRGIKDLLAQLGEDVAAGSLRELTMTTNGLKLAGAVGALRTAGVRRINVSLDTLDPDLFRRLTRWGELEQVLDGIAAAHEAGLSVKINTVVLKGLNDRHLDTMIAWAGAHHCDLTFIEAMPMGGLSDLHGYHFLPLEKVGRDLARRWQFLPSRHATGGPARYVTVAETGGTVGFITALSRGYCGSCNRVRVSSTGGIIPCLGQESSAEVRDLIRSTSDDAALEQAILAAVSRKPRGHRFGTEKGASAERPGRSIRMNRTGG